MSAFRYFSYLLAAFQVFMALFFLTVWLPMGLSMPSAPPWEKGMMALAAALVALIAVSIAVYIVRDDPIP